MGETIKIDRFTRNNQSVEGRIAPSDLPGLSDFLAEEGGEIRYSFAGSITTHVSGSQKRNVKCIISGWFLLPDPVTLLPERHEVDIESHLVIVRDESALPPLEMETADEDYIVCGEEMNIMERVEEEILLDMPFSQAPGRTEAKRAAKGSSKAAVASPPAKVSPFAKLAALKKK